MDSLLHKLWRLHQLTAGLRMTTIMAATVWLEQNYARRPQRTIALGIAVHYLLLSLRSNSKMTSRNSETEPDKADSYRDEARTWIQAAAGLPVQLPQFGSTFDAPAALCFKTLVREVEIMRTNKNWEITLCPAGKVKLHCQIAPSNAEKGLLGVAEELRQVADELAAAQSSRTFEHPDLPD